jgi:prepilin-type N-terminal cleavage/methylation domain-containing protein
MCMTQKRTAVFPMRKHAAFTLIEVVVSVMITGVVFAGILTGYIQSAKKAEWSGYSLAAEALNVQQLEQIRAAKWDTQGNILIDETTNLNLVGWTYAAGKWSGHSWTNLDTPFNSTNNNVVYATNYVVLSTVVVTNLPLVTVKLIQTETVWKFQGKLFTNSIATYRAPDA